MHTRTTNAKGIAAGLGLAMAMAGCGFLDKLDTTTGPNSLSIRQFVAAPTRVAPGGSTTLSWDVTGATTIRLDHGIGVVAAKGSQQVTVAGTTVFALSATAEGASAEAKVTVSIDGNAPSPSPSPSPAGSPSPSPSPSASPSPGPSPSPSPSPNPSPSPGASCGTSVTTAGNCAVTITRSVTLPANECLQIPVVTLNNACPVGVNTHRSLRFEVAASTARTNLRWRRAPGSSDVLTPSGGEISRNGTTAVLIDDLVLAPSVTIEIFDGNGPLLAFTVRHY